MERKVARCLSRRANRLAPSAPASPLEQLRLRHEADGEHVPDQVGSISRGEGMAVEQVGNNVGVEQARGHELTPGAARDSRIDSMNFSKSASSAHRSAPIPIRASTSWGPAMPCSAASSASERLRRSRPDVKGTVRGGVLDSGGHLFFLQARPSPPIHPSPSFFRRRMWW